MEQQILARLAKEYGQEIYGFCYRLTQNQSDAEDLFQDTFLKALQLKHRLELYAQESSQEKQQDAMRKNRNFLMGIAANLWKNTFRKKKKYKHTIALDITEDNEFELSSTYNLESDVEKQELLTTLNHYVNQLPEKIRIVTCMYYTAEMKTQEIATALKLPKGTVTSRLNLARRRLRKKMKEDGYEV